MPSPTRPFRSLTRKQVWLRVLLTVLILAAGVAPLISGCATGGEPDRTGWQEGPLTFYKPNTDCPPGDVGGWYKADVQPATKVVWIVNPPSIPVSKNRNAIASAAIGALTPDGVGRVAAYTTREMASTTTINHEDCHTQGWRHFDR